VEDTSDPQTDAYDARALHAAMRADGRPALCIPHVGGRYANLGSPRQDAGTLVEVQATGAP